MSAKKLSFAASLTSEYLAQFNTLEHILIVK